MTSVEPVALRERYRRERDKRLRPDGTSQYIEIAGDFAHFAADPFSAPQERASIEKDVEVLVVGGGFGGLLLGARLQEVGIDDVCIVDKAADFGGTWYWNRYPGVRCDVDAYIYLPLLEELGVLPSEKYATGAEILAHSRAIGRHYGLDARALFQTEVCACRWDDELRRWRVSTDRGDTICARFVCIATGPWQGPKLPGIPGIGTFRGHSFHTTRWDYGCTGGDASGGLDGLRGTRVGIIGTGASAVQCVPHVAEFAEHLYVFQRTPSSVDVRIDQPTDRAWGASLESGWQRRRMENFNNFFSGVYEPVDLVDDAWTDLVHIVLALADGAAGDITSPTAAEQVVEAADFAKMEQLRARVDAVVQDPATADALKPYYRLFCKRPCFSEDYLATFNRGNVTLVDTDGRGVDRITPRGVVAGETEIALDCLIYATGFDVGADHGRGSALDIVGRGGMTMRETWAQGPSTLHGIHSRGFPNCFSLRAAQAAFTINFPHLLEEQSRHIAYILGWARAHDVTVIEAEAAAEAEWVATITARAGPGIAFHSTCTPGYFNNEGRPDAGGARNSFYGGGSQAYFAELARWRAEGTLAGLELT